MYNNVELTAYSTYIVRTDSIDIGGKCIDYLGSNKKMRMFADIT